MIARTTQPPIVLDALRWPSAAERFHDRFAAGAQLAQHLQLYRGTHALVLALPPGGVPVAHELARLLRLPLDSLLARELCVHPYPAVVAGALCEAGGLCLNGAALRLPGMSLAAVWREARRVQHEIAGLVERYRGSRPLPSCTRRAVILVDDGLGSGLVQLAALQRLRHLHPQQCIVATPAGTLRALQRVAGRAEAVVALACAGEEPSEQLVEWSAALGDDDAVALLEQERELGSPTVAAQWSER